jgi:hypothetical protein
MISELFIPSFAQVNLTTPLHSYCSALFCTGAFHNSFTINSFRTLCQKHRGVGIPPALFLFVPDRYYCRRCCHRRCRPVVAPLRNNGKRPISLFSSCHYPTLSSAAMGGTPPPPPKVLSALHFFASGNSVGSAGGWSAMASSSGKCTRSGSGTFTFERLRMLMSWRALTTALPW